MTDEPITVKDSIINISQLQHAQVCIDENATKKLRHIYDWLECTIKVLEAL